MQLPRYLTWQPDEPQTARVERIAAHATDTLTAALERAHDQGGAEGQVTAQTVEIVGAQTLAARPRRVEVTVMAEATDHEAGRVIPSNLTVVVREEDGAWLIDDLL